jgi:hypothetical protein
MSCVCSREYLIYNHAGQLTRSPSLSGDDRSFHEIFLKDADLMHKMNHQRDRLVLTLRNWVGAELVNEDADS